MSPVNIRYVSDTSLQVNFELVIKVEVNHKVQALYKNLTEKPLDGVVEVIPATATLAVYYDPEQVSYQELSQQILDRVEAMDFGQMNSDGAGGEILEVPILYGGELGPDLAEVARMQGVSEEEIIEMHTRNLSYVYSLVFTPGHPASARDKDAFNVSRKTVPTKRSLPRSVVVIDKRTEILPFEQPCGWQIIGSTPLLITDFRKEAPFLMKPGQWLKFISIQKDEYDEIKDLCDRGIYVPKIYPKGADR